MRAIKRCLISVAGPMLLCFAGTAAMAQHIKFPKQTPKDHEATEVAGIGSYTLILDGKHAIVQGFDVEGRALAQCEIDWFDDSRSMECTMSQGGRFRASWYAQRAEFEDLATHDHFSIEFDDVELEAADRFESDELQRKPHRGWSFRGTKSQEEVERDWGAITPVFAYLLAEVELTLGGVPGDQSTLLDQTLSPLEPDDLILCPGGISFCNSKKKCRKSALALTKSDCCATASKDADQCCKSLTGTECCANSLCSSICFLGFFCDCYLDGWQYDCEYCIFT